MKRFLEMLQYMRPDGSGTQKEFCRKYLAPVFGDPDRFGNYALTVGKSRLAFTAHHDTVHVRDGRQVVLVRDGVVGLPPESQSTCLGADCTAGIWLILEMIRSGIPGNYVVHAGEELGCVGSRAFVEHNSRLLDGLDAVISFDRRGTDSIVTHQLGYRTASDEFAFSLSDMLGLPEMLPDPTGAYTDSNEYVDHVSECTNISVGYYGQHSKSETQDLNFLAMLRDRLIGANWSDLVIARDPFDCAFLGEETLADIVRDNPDAVAEYLGEFGITADELRTAIGIGFWK